MIQGSITRCVGDAAAAAARVLLFFCVCVCSALAQRLQKNMESNCWSKGAVCSPGICNDQSVMVR